MLIRFGFGQIHIGRPSGVGKLFDAAITFCWRKRHAEPEAPQWRLVMRLAWNWLPICRYEPVLGTHGIDSSRWTGRSKKFVGYGEWPRELSIFKSDWRSKMYVYLTGSKEKANPDHILYVAPAAHPGRHMSKNDIPAEWLDDNSKPKTFAITFAYGRASVDDKLGEWLIATGMAYRTNLVRATGKSLLGNLAKTISGR